MLRNLSAVLLSIIIFNGPEHALFGQNDGDISTPCNAHLGSITDTQPHAYEKYFEWTQVPKAATALANQKLPNTVDIVALAPVTLDEYKRLFFHGKDKDKQTVTEAQRTEIERVRSTLKANFGKEQGDRNFNERTYKDVLQAKTASFVIIVGHNEHGMLHTLDGGSLFLDDIPASARLNQRVILISCDSASAVSNKRVAGTITRKVTYDVAFAIASKVSTFIKSASGPISLAEIQSEMTKQVESTQRNHKIAFFIMRAACVGGTAIIVALIIRELDPCKDKDSPDCSKGK